MAGDDRPESIAGLAEPQSAARALEGACRALSHGRWSEAASAVHDALGLWRGAPLADLAYEPFAQEAILRLEDLRVAAIEQRIEADLALGRHSDLVSELEALVAQHPLRERLRGQLMLALYRCGRQADALAAYRRTRRTLVEELGIDPSPALRRLERGMLRQDPSLDAPAAAESPVEAGDVEATRLLMVLVAEVGGAAAHDELPDDVLAVLVDAVFGHGGRIEGFPNGGCARSSERRRRARTTRRTHCSPLSRSATACERAASRRRSRSTRATARSSSASGCASRPGPARSRWVPPRTGPRGSRSTSRPSPSAPELPTSCAGGWPRPRKARGIEGLRADMRGRDADLAELRATVAAAVARSCRMVAIVGEAGVGKSRLVAELRGPRRRGRPGRGPALARGTVPSLGRRHELPAVQELLGEHFGWAPMDDDREREMRLVSATGGLAHLSGARADEIVALLANLLSVRLTRGPSAPLADVPPEQLRNRTFAAVRDFVVALAAERPLVLVLEDFHWADALSPPRSGPSRRRRGTRSSSRRSSSR